MAYSSSARTAFETAYSDEKTAKSGYDIKAPKRAVAKATIAATVPMPLTNMYGSDKFIRPLQLQEITGHYKRLLEIMGRLQL